MGTLRIRPCAFSAAISLLLGRGWLFVAGTAVAWGQAEPAEATSSDWLADRPWRSGRTYSVYDPHYGRPSPEVRRNQAMSGSPLALRRHVYARGIGASGFSIVELDVPPGVTALAALVGIDDHPAQAGGETYFSVWSDGQRLWQSPALSRDDPALAIVVPVASRARIALVTDSQGYGNRDLADWCEATWLRSPVAVPQSGWLPAAGAWHLRAELHPFHLLYHGEELPVAVVHDVPAEVTLTYGVVGETGAAVLRGEVPVRLVIAAGQGGAACGTVRLPLAGLPNGLFDLDLAVAGPEALRRRIRFGVLTSRLGRPVDGSIYGVNHHEFVASYEALAAAGIEWSRLWFCRAWIEPRQGDWQWHWHDERLAAAREFGIKTIGVLGGIGQPAWTSPEHVPAAWQTTHGYPADLEAWDEYVRQVAARYRGQVRIWESWNEIMGAAESGRHGWSVARYVDLHRRTWQVLKTVDPGNRLMVSADRLSFVERCLKAGLGDAFDGVVIHPYRPSLAPEAICANATAGGSGDLGSVFTASRAWLDGRQRRDAGIWATEIGWAVSGNEWPVVSIETHGQYLPRTFLLAQASGAADNVCWHDVALGMFGICDGQGFPRPALLGFAGLTERLLGAAPVRRLPAGEGALHGVLFQRAGADVLALWSEAGTEFAMLMAPQPLRLARFDVFGNRREYAVDTAGAALPVTGRVQYLEGTGLNDVRITRVQPVAIAPEALDVVAGQRVQLRCTVHNVLADAGDFRVSLASSKGFAPTEPVTLDIARGDRRAVDVPLTALRDTSPGTYVMALSVGTPAGIPVPLTVLVRVVPPLGLNVGPFDTAAIGQRAVQLSVSVANRDAQPLSGELVLNVPLGMTVTPATHPFGPLPSGGSTRITAALVATRPPRPGEALTAVAHLADGARVEMRRSLVPAIADADGDGLADGWRLNPQSSRAPGEGNVAEATLEPGDTEFLSQRIRCSRFTDGWIILHRDHQDRIVKGKRYRITFRARQQGIAGTVGVAVYNIQPWESCGIERQVRIGTDWAAVGIEFTATRDSRAARFEFFFTETGTLWLEAMRLDDTDQGSR